MHDAPATPRIHLSIRNVQKAYGNYVAVHDASLDVRGGEFVALLGPSGCGKTTLLRAIAGLVAPTAGDILIDGTSIVDIPANRRGIGMVFQSYALFPHMSVADNVAFGLRMSKVPRRQIPGSVHEALKLVRLENLADRYPRQLSGGQQQRVAVARAIVTKPKVLLLDEPLAALDAKLRETMRLELTQLQRRLGLTTIFVTHDQHEALAMADRVAVLQKGRVEQFDTPKRIYHQPATAFVADFVGQMNRVSGKLTATNETESRLLAGNPSFEILARRMDTIPVGSSVVAMVRPECVVIDRAERKADARQNLVRGVISAALFSGETTHWVVSTALGDLMASSRDGIAPRDRDFAVGISVSLVWRAEDTHVFRT